jgi:hypothetical protein
MGMILHPKVSKQTKQPIFGLAIVANDTTNKNEKLSQK